MNNLLSIRSIAFVSVVFYLIFDYLDGKRVKDEREELIQLKSLKFAHQATIITLAPLSLCYWLFPWVSSIYIIFAVILAALYTEIWGKLYYRSKL